MMRVVVDTNVLLVANGAHSDVGEACRDECTARLLRLAKKGRVVIDDANEIVEEYLRRTAPHRGQRAGDAFLKWLLNNQGNPKRVERVTTTPTAGSSYEELDALGLPMKVDPSDRKFIAAAASAETRATIWEAADSKWLDWWQAVHASGLRVDFVCPHDIVRFYRRKYPRRKVPPLP